MWHSSAIPADFGGHEAVAPTLDLVLHELKPLVATFFTVAEDGEIQAAVAHGSHLPPAQLAEEVSRWEGWLRGVDPLAPATIAQLTKRVVTLADVGGAQRAVLDKGWVRGAYEQIGVINDVRMTIREGDRLVAGVALWRRLQWRTWTDSELRRLSALQPLIELAFLSCVRTASSIDASLLATLTPRQRQVARLLARGATTPDVARALFISTETAKSHVQAVLERLNVGSRRELVQRLKQSPEARAPGRSFPRTTSSQRDWDEASFRFQGDREAQQPLKAVLEWTTERIGVVAGGCTFVSNRGEPAGEAYGATREVDLGLVQSVHRRLLSQPPSAIVEYLEADPRRPAVLEPDGTWPVPIDPLAQLTADAHLTTPLVAVLHRQGRVAGLIWLCRDTASPLDQAQSARELRRIHPLLDLMHVPGGAASTVRAASADDLVKLALSERELAVARMALGGESNATIARRLGISESTVKKHVGRVLAKTGVRSRTQLIASLGDMG